MKGRFVQQIITGFPGGADSKESAAMRETWVRSLGREDTLDKGMAIHSNKLAWEIPRTESLADYSPWNCKESDTTESLHFHVLMY